MHLRRDAFQAVSAFNAVEHAAPHNVGWYRDCLDDRACELASIPPPSCRERPCFFNAVARWHYGTAGPMEDIIRETGAGDRAEHRAWTFRSGPLLGGWATCGVNVLWSLQRTWRLTPNRVARQSGRCCRQVRCADATNTGADAG
jgi:hypothetical protein